MLNRRLRAVLPLHGRILEIGNGRRRRGIETGATLTLDVSVTRAPHVQADALRLPFADGTFDAVVCCETLQYVADAVVALREMHRVLRRGGSLVISLPNGLKRQPDEAQDPQRWTRGMARALALMDFAVDDIKPLWPPLGRYTSGWFVEARAA